ncbi:6418_t:CDS:2 [Entrophospora sp. SA101]|nr:6418_t:CDS:2 [Entrophospora sp. SA101]
MIWNPKKYIINLKNFIDLGAYLLPITTSILWLYYGSPPDKQLISLSYLMTLLKFILFFRYFRGAGVYFAIISGVAANVFPFLVILSAVSLGFSCAFYILLRPVQDFTLDKPIFNNDSNNPWNIATKYYTIFMNNNTYEQNSLIVQQPDDNTNMFAYFISSVLATYNFLTGDNQAFGFWSLQDDPYLACLYITFSFVVVVYLMNLFIGLLTNEIKEFNLREALLYQQAKFIAEIELFYLLPCQLVDIREKIRETDNSKKDPGYLPFISDELRELVEMPKPEKDIDIHLKFEQVENNFKNELNKIKQEIKDEIKNELKEVLDQIRNEIKMLKN